MTKEEAISQIRAGKLAIENDGTVDQLNRVLRLCWPADLLNSKGRSKFYIERQNGWQGDESTHLDVIKVTELVQLIEEKPVPQLLPSENSEEETFTYPRSVIEKMNRKTKDDEVEINRLRGELHEAFQVIEFFKSQPLPLAQSDQTLSEMYSAALGIIKDLQAEIQTLKEERDRFAMGLMKFIQEFKADRGRTYSHEKLLELYKESLTTISKKE